MGWYHEMLCCKGADWLQNYKPWNHNIQLPGSDWTFGELQSHIVSFIGAVWLIVLNILI